MITVLRLGHRPDRDKRITTHVALVARAFGADSILVSTNDEKLENTVNGVNKRFGGPFKIETGTKWKGVIKNFAGQIVHLTMYGGEMDTVIPQIDPSKDLLIIVGATKVPRSVFEKATFNVSVGNQPHSEVAALAVFLDHLTQGDGLTKEFLDYEMKVIPNIEGKTVVNRAWIPSEEECIGMLQDEGVEENVINHIMAVSELVEKIADRLNLIGIEFDEEALMAGSLLHDIGRAQDHGIEHAIRGIEILKDYDVSQKVLDIVQTHIGAGLDSQEAKELGLPEDDYMPLTLEQKIVAGADNLFVGSKRIPLQKELDDLKKKGLENAAKKVKSLHEELSKILKMDLNDL